MSDYYSILGVEKGSSQSEIKKAYRKVAMKYHPDRNPDNKDAESKFKEAAEAYSVLSDPDKRARYDQFGHDNFVNSNGMGAGGANMDVNDIFSMFGDLFSGGGSGGSPFSSFFGDRTGSRQSSENNNLKISIALTLEEICSGTTKKIKITRLERSSTSKAAKCTKCSGSGQVKFVQNTMLGQVVNVQMCPSCKGVGYVGGRDKKTATVPIEIPPGVSDGNYLSLDNAGNQSIHSNGNDGDLIVYFTEKEHPVFTRSNNDIYVECNLNYMDAVLGSEIEVPTLYGNVKVNIPAGIQNGTMLRLKEKGVTELNRHRKGNQYIKIVIDVPKNITKSAKNIVADLKNEIGNIVEFKKISN